MKFDGVGNEILQQLAHLVGIDFQGRQGIVADFGPTFPNQGLQILEGPLEDIFQAGRDQWNSAWPTREKDKRSLIRACMRLAPSVI